MGNWTSSSKEEGENCVTVNDEAEVIRQLSEEKQEEVDEFKAELARKRQMRREILTAKKAEFETLKREIEELKEENRRLKEAAQDPPIIPTLTEQEDIQSKMLEIDKASSLINKNRELQVSIAQMQGELQNLNSAMADFEKEREEYKAHISALKEVINISKKMLLIRESQLKELKEKVEAIEKSVSEKEINILSKDLRMEYEKQLQIMRNMRTVYEERQRTDYLEKQELKKLIDVLKREVEDEKKKNRESEERIIELQEVNSKKYDEIKTLESSFGLAKAESRQYQAELAVINQLFSEILLGFNTTQDIDLDKLIRHLEDNHALLQNIVSGEKSSESSFALPKVLLDLVHQVHNPKPETDDNRLKTIIEESEESQNLSQQINSVEEIVELLPKVWRVLIELLSHQKVPMNDLTQESTSDDPCYKTVQTPKGPSLVLSVSQTFIRLKDLILEKKSLEKETCHLKQLNTHLESRLSDQERRLEMVSTELNKTWHVVGKLQKQHQHLHTQEKILRYELAQKRKLLTTLKEELEDSRGKWQEAREKNSKTEKQWKQLRIEFASRRATLLSDEFNNSQESGYSDEKCSSSEDEPGYETDVSEIGSKVNNACEEVDDNEGSKDELEEASNNDTEADAEKKEQLRLLAREERLQRLESQCGQLMTQVKNTGKKSVELSNKLDDIHSVYGGSSNAAEGQSTSTATEKVLDPESSDVNG